MALFSWIYTNANKIQEILNPCALHLSPSVVVRFLNLLKNLELRQITSNFVDYIEKKQISKVKYTAALMKWHCEIRELMVKIGPFRSNCDSKWGGHTPDKRFNVDQASLPLAINRKTAYERSVSNGEKKDYKFWVSQPAMELEKRQRSMQVFLSPFKDEFCVTTIFQDKGKRITADEKKHTTRK